MHIIRFETAPVVTSSLASEITVLSLYVEFLVISRSAGACQVQTLTGHVCLQDAVPPELLHVLQNSKDPLLQKLFPVTEKNQNNTKTQKRAAVVTVVSKFKVHPIQVSAVILETFWIYHQQFDEGIHRVDF